MTWSRNCYKMSWSAYCLEVPNEHVWSKKFLRMLPCHVRCFELKTSYAMLNFTCTLIPEHVIWLSWLTYIHTHIYIYTHTTTQFSIFSESFSLSIQLALKINNSFPCIDVDHNTVLEGRCNSVFWHPKIHLTFLCLLLYFVLLPRFVDSLPPFAGNDIRKSAGTCHSGRAARSGKCA